MKESLIDAFVESRHIELRNLPVPFWGSRMEIEDEIAEAEAARAHYYNSVDLAFKLLAENTTAGLIQNASEAHEVFANLAREQSDLSIRLEMFLAQCRNRGLLTPAQLSSIARIPSLPPKVAERRAKEEQERRESQQLFDAIVKLATRHGGPGAQRDVLNLWNAKQDRDRIMTPELLGRFVKELAQGGLLPKEYIAGQAVGDLFSRVIRGQKEGLR